MARSLVGEQVTQLKQALSTAISGLDHGNRQATTDTYVLWDSRSMETGTSNPSLVWEGYCGLYGGRAILYGAGNHNLTARYAVRAPYSARTAYYMNTIHRLACSEQDYSEYGMGLRNVPSLRPVDAITIRHRVYLDGHETVSILSSLASRFLGEGYSTNIEVIPQSRWNIDAMDGTGVSKISILSDRTKDNKQDDGIYYRSFSCIIVNENGPLGSWKIGFIVEGTVYFAHELAVFRGNIYGSAATAGPFPYAVVPHCYTSGASAALAFVYGEITANGPRPIETPTRSNAYLIPTQTATGGNSAKPVLSIQLNSLAIDTESNWMAASYMLPTQLTIANTGSVCVTYTITFGAALTGDAFVDQDAQRSIAAIDTSAGDMTGGIAVIVGFVMAGSSYVHDLSALQGGRRIGRSCSTFVRDVLTVSAHTGQAETSTVRVGLAWNEFH